MFNFPEFFINYFPDIFGGSGVAIIPYYYLLLQINKCISDSLSFSVANFVGSIFLLTSLGFYRYQKDKDHYELLLWIVKVVKLFLP